MSEQPDLFVARSVLRDGRDRTAIVDVRPRRPPDEVAFLLLHGAGSASSGRLTKLAADLAAAGHRTVAFDAYGHGQSSGVLAEQSLRSRFEQAAHVLDRLFDGPVVVVGFSMGGQTATDIVGRRPDGVRGVVLCAPAAYGDHCFDVPFGAGFTELIRQPESWAGSPAFDQLRRFPGPAALCLPESDEVIPAGVTRRYHEALLAGGHDCRIVHTVDGASHQLGTWFDADDVLRRRAVGVMLTVARRTAGA